MGFVVGFVLAENEVHGTVSRQNLRREDVYLMADDYCWNILKYDNTFERT